MKKKQTQLIDEMDFADISVEVKSMKISTFLQSINQNTKASAVQTQKESSVSESLITEYKSTASKEVQSIFDKYQIKPTSDQLEQVSSFMSQSKGTKVDKLQTLDIALYKGIDPTTDNLQTIHQALQHDAEVVKSLAEVPNVGDAKVDASTVEKTIEFMKLPESIKNAIKKQMADGSSLKDALRSVMKLINDKFPGAIEIKNKASVEDIIKAVQSFASKNPSKALVFLLDNSKEYKGVSDLIIEDMSEASIKSLSNKTASIDTDLSRVLLGSSNDGSAVGSTDDSIMAERRSQPRITMEALLGSDQGKNGLLKTVNVEAKVISEWAIDRFDKDVSEGNPPMVDSLDDSLDDSNTAEVDILSLVEQVVESMIENMEDVFARISESMDFRSYLIESTTNSTIQAKNQFENFRAETIKLLQTAIEPQNSASMAANLSKAIEKLNHIILKSDVTLFTDMFTEKKLLIMAAELDKAQGYVKQGDLSKANEVVKKAISLLEQINFNPSHRRVQVFAQNKIEKIEKILDIQEKNSQKLDHQILKQIETTHEGQGSKMARDILETLRFLGLNHEMEVAESLEGVDDETQKDWAQGNVKELLLKLMKEDIKDKSVAATEQNLMNFSGQQMMNDSGNGQQPFYFFNYPIIDGEELGNMKVYMKGASNNQQLDWKNAELYFGVTLKNTGALGIKVKIQQERVSFELMSNSDTGVERKLAQVMDELVEIGFTKGDIKLRNYTDDSGIVLKPVLDVPQSKVSTPIDAKGFDFKI